MPVMTWTQTSMRSGSPWSGCGTGRSRAATGVVSFPLEQAAQVKRGGEPYSLLALNTLKPSTPA